MLGQTVALLWTHCTFANGSSVSERYRIIFSGMSRAIIHNSDYRSLDDAKAAIDRYFEERNTWFLAHPKKAGKKIWGKEREAAVFSVSSNCKDPRYR